MSKNITANHSSNVATNGSMISTGNNSTNVQGDGNKIILAKTFRRGLFLGFILGIIASVIASFIYDFIKSL